MSEKITKEIMSQVKKVITGKDDVIARMMMAILAGGHILLEDVPGVGKTQMAIAFSKAMDMKYRRMQFTPDTMASDIVGFSVYNKEKGSFEYKEGAVLCNLFLADEINRTSAKTQAALLEVMEENSVTVDGNTYNVPEPFICIATQNPLGSAGTQKLPDSQLDRFMVRLTMGYPTIREQMDIVRAREIQNPVKTVEKVASAGDILAAREEVKKVSIQDDVLEYAALLCEKTRTCESIEQGVSPRAVIAFIKMARAAAYIDDRDYVTPEDIKSLFVDVCAHRVVLTARAKIKKETEAGVLEGILKEVKIPSVLKG